MQMILIMVFAVSAPSLAWSQAEWTEHKSPYEPTGAEQLVLEIINRARANPFVEGTRLASFSIPLPGGDITEGLPTPGNVGARPPLAMNGMLLKSARDHSDDMYTRDYFTHDTLSPPTETWSQRINAAGYSGTLGENIATSSSGTASFLEDFLMVDWIPGFGAYPNRGHRSNLLDVDSGANPFREVGVGYHLGASARPSGYKDFLTEDFGRRAAAGPFLVGVVYDDTAISFYAAGKGIGGVDVRTIPAGTNFAITGTAGGYAFPVGSSGTVVVRATGGAFGASIVYKAVTLRGKNVKVDFKLSDLSIVDSDADGLPDSWETSHFSGSLTQTAGDDPDGDGFTNIEELNAGSDPMDPLSTPVPVTPPPPPPPGGTPGGACGSTGLDLLWPLGLLWLRRRSRRTT
jgi:hypothetical protein